MYMYMYIYEGSIAKLVRALTRLDRHYIHTHTPNTGMRTHVKMGHGRELPAAMKALQTIHKHLEQQQRMGGVA